MQLLLLFFFLFSVPLVAAQSKGIAFSEDSSWEELKSEAQKEKKLLFVSLSAQWCASCRAMRQQVYTLDSIGEFYRAHFIATQYDGERDSIGLWLVQNYQLQGYPALLFFDAQGQLLHYAFGKHSPETFMKLSGEALSPETQLQSLKRSYLAGERNPEFLYNYAYLLWAKQEPESEHILLSYLSTQKQWNSPRAQQIILDLAQDKESPPFQFFLDNHKRFAQNLGKERVEAKLEEAALHELGQKIQELGEEFSIEHDIAPCFERYYPKEQAQKKTQYYQLLFYANASNWEQFFPLAQSYERYYIWFKRRGKDEEERAREYLDIARMVSDNSTKTKHLKWAAKRAKRSVLVNSSYQNCYILSTYYYQMGYIKSSKRYLRKAIRKGKRMSKKDARFLAELEKLEAELKEKRRAKWRRK